MGPAFLPMPPTFPQQLLRGHHGLHPRTPSCTCSDENISICLREISGMQMVSLCAHGNFMVVSVQIYHSVVECLASVIDIMSSPVATREQYYLHVEKKTPFLMQWIALVLPEVSTDRIVTGTIRALRQLVVPRMHCGSTPGSVRACNSNSLFFTHTVTVAI
eukprot:m.33411 g.33411  ORF g.33411 m.33411 type:complete len:161 (+) comp14231_c0_seq2:309-791(+)